MIGVGNDLRRDDAVGRVVAEAIEQRALPAVTVLTRTQLLPELVEPISRADRVVFVDASVEAREVSVGPVVAEPGSGDSHHSTPGALLGLAARLGLDCPPAFLVEVSAHDLSLGEGLSEGTAAAVEQAIAEVIDLITAGDLSGR